MVSINVALIGALIGVTVSTLGLMIVIMRVVYMHGREMGGVVVQMQDAHDEILSLRSKFHHLSSETQRLTALSEGVSGRPAWRPPG